MKRAPATNFETAKDAAAYAANLTEELRAMFPPSALKSVTVEAAGRWVWVYGYAKDIKEHLKEKGFRWSRTKTAWYLSGAPSLGRGGFDRFAIALKYGAVEFKPYAGQEVK